MKSDYQDGDDVVLYKPGHQWHNMQFKAYKSQYTLDAYRLKYGEREYIADVSEIRPLSESNRIVQEDQYGNIPLSDDMYLQMAQGTELDRIGGEHCILRETYFGGSLETDVQYRERILDYLRNDKPLKFIGLDAQLKGAGF